MLKILEKFPFITHSNREAAPLKPVFITKAFHNIHVKGLYEILSDFLNKLIIFRLQFKRRKQLPFRNIQQLNWKLETDKFHTPGCGDVDKMDPSNKITFSSRDEAISSGYDPCGHCNP